MSTRIPIRYSKAWSFVLDLVLLPPHSAYLEIDDATVRVRMGYAFDATFARADVFAVGEWPTAVVSIGVHGRRGRWLVNGASRPIARITMARPVRAHVLGVAVKLSELLVSVDDVARLEGLLVT